MTTMVCVRACVRSPTNKKIDLGSKSSTEETKLQIIVFKVCKQGNDIETCCLAFGLLNSNERVEEGQ